MFQDQINLQKALDDKCAYLFHYNIYSDANDIKWVEENAPDITEQDANGVTTTKDWRTQRSEDKPTCVVTICIVETESGYRSGITSQHPKFDAWDRPKGNVIAFNRANDNTEHTNLNAIMKDIELELYRFLDKNGEVGCPQCGHGAVRPVMTYRRNNEPITVEQAVGYISGFISSKNTAASQ